MALFSPEIMKYFRHLQIEQTVYVEMPLLAYLKGSTQANSKNTLQKQTIGKQYQHLAWAAVSFHSLPLGF